MPPTIRKAEAVIKGAALAGHTNTGTDIDNIVSSVREATKLSTELVLSRSAQNVNSLFVPGSKLARLLGPGGTSGRRTQHGLLQASVVEAISDGLSSHSATTDTGARHAEGLMPNVHALANAARGQHANVGRKSLLSRTSNAVSPAV